MTRRTIVALLLLLLAPGGALACSCVWAGPFTKVALRRELVVLGEVRAYHRHGMDVAVLEVLKGAETRSTIRIWGDTGMHCRPYVTAFPRGTRWIFAVQPVRWSDTDTDGHGYVVSSCGDYWLEARGEQAVGRITLVEYDSRAESVPLADMRAWIRSGGTTSLTPRPLR